jgi:uncharacterized membrane protein YqiK
VQDDKLDDNELVENNYKGVWKNPLKPGKYPFNIYAGKIIKVPTTNFILKWISDKNNTYTFDKDLREISLITKDAFEISLPLSALLRIEKKNAPLVIQKFGNVSMLVNQTIDPMVSAYFKNIGQTKTIIQIIQERNEIQQLALREMKMKFNFYFLNLEEVLIGTPSSPKIDKILTQLRDRQIAVEQKETYLIQKLAADVKKDLIEAESNAEQQKYLTKSKVNIEIEKNQAEADYERGKQEARKIELLAEAEAKRNKLLGEAEADNKKKNIEAFEGNTKYYLTENIMTKFAEAVKEGKIDIVPKTLINSNGNSTEGKANTDVFNLLLSSLINEQMDEKRLFKLFDENEKNFIGDSIKKFRLKGKTNNELNDTKNIKNVNNIDKNKESYYTIIKSEDEEEL